MHDALIAVERCVPELKGTDLPRLSHSRPPVEILRQDARRSIPMLAVLRVICAQVDLG
jgi:hypothetical protein